MACSHPNFGTTTYFQGSPLHAHLAGELVDLFAGFVRWRCPQLEWVQHAGQIVMLGLRGPGPRTRLINFYDEITPEEQFKLKISICFGLDYICCDIYEYDLHIRTHNLEYCNPDIFEQLERLIADAYTTACPTCIIIPEPTEPYMIVMPTAFPDDYHKSDFLWLPKQRLWLIGSPFSVILPTDGIV